jgi:hypothetical protein
VADTHHFKNPWLEPLHFFFSEACKFSMGTSTRVGIIEFCRENWSDRSPPATLFMLQDVCAEATKRIGASQNAAYTQRIHQNKLDHARELLLAIQGTDEWDLYAQRARHIADDIILLDEFLGADRAKADVAKELNATTLEGVKKFLEEVSSDSDLPGELKEIVIGQLGLLQRSIGRFDVMGVTSFQEVIELSYGKLSLAMNCSAEPNTLKRIQDILNFLLKIHSLASMAVDGVKLLQHIPIRALPAPSRDGDRQD